MAASLRPIARFLLSWSVMCICWYSPLHAVRALKFYSMGDWGDAGPMLGTPRVAARLEADVASSPTAFVALLGDNFYDSGVRSVNDPQFTQKYLKVMNGPALNATKFYVTAGNHDYYGNVTAQVEYTHVDPTHRWDFPSLYYARLVRQRGVSVFLVMVDTWRLNGGDAIMGIDPETGRKWIRSHAALREAVRDGRLTPASAEDLARRYPVMELPAAASPPDEKQYAWLERMLRSPAARVSDWIIVGGHFPVYSASFAEHGDTSNLVRRLAPLFQKYHVDAYLSGHDHILQHLRGENEVEYFGSGAGAKFHVGVHISHPRYVHSADGNFGFMRHEATKHTLTTTFVVAYQNGSCSMSSYAVVTPRRMRATAPANPVLIAADVASA